MARTKIVATIGPACTNPETIKGMLEAGMTVARINFSHGDHASHVATVSMLRAVAKTQKKVLAIMGDGSIGFHLSEFETAVRYELPFVAIVGNDARWNAEHQIQLRNYGDKRLIGCELTLARYDLAVAGLGGHGEYVTKAEQLTGALERAIASGLPACVNVKLMGLPAPSFA